ncbi:hypothetical protein [Streptomyces sp. NBC_01497]|uniref:hypothetical protein n=1 Tax=Streptomyces sp. NBC_01497 TaxID=2903885 RepID=UPI002E2FFDC9|nr:hypothetical protein [Streptomyces sp. NBC_01497]
MSRTPGSPAKVSGTATDDEVESWGTMTDDDLKTWGMAPADEAGAEPAIAEGADAEAGPRATGSAVAPAAHDAQDQDPAAAVHQASADDEPAEAEAEAVADTQAPAAETANSLTPGDGSAVAAADPAELAAPAEVAESAEVAELAAPAQAAERAEPAARTAEEPVDVVASPGPSTPQGSPAGAGAPPEHEVTDNGAEPRAEAPAAQPLPPEQPVVPVPARREGDGEAPRTAQTVMADEDAPTAAEPPATAGVVPEKPAPTRSARRAPLPAEPLIRSHPPTGHAESALRVVEPTLSVSGTGSAQESGAVDPARTARRRGKPLLAAAGAAGVLLVGMPLLLLGRGHDGEKQEARSDVPVGTVLDSTDTEVGHVITDIPTSPGPGKHRGPTAKSTAHPVAHVSPSALLKQKTAKHAANDSSTHGIQVHTAQPKSDGGTPAPNKVKSKTTTRATDIRAHATTVVIQATRTLSAGESWSATLARMTMRSDGDLVIYDEHGQVRWSSHTSGTGNRAAFQGDGNLVVYNTANQPLWASGTAGHNGAALVLQADGNVVISQNGAALWASGTQH